MDGRGDARADPQEIWQDAGLVDDAALLETAGVFFAEAANAGGASRDPQKIAAWLRSDYPRIAARAKREKAAIYWSDATGVNNQDQIGKSYAPKGKTPVLTPTGQKFSPSMIAAASNRGLMRFRLYKGAPDAAIFVDFMKRLIKDAKQQPFSIVDNPRVQHWRWRGWRDIAKRSRFSIFRPMRRNRTRTYLSTTIKSKRSTTNRAARPATISSQPPRRSSNPSRSARIGSSHTTPQNTFAMQPE